MFPLFLCIIDQVNMLEIEILLKEIVQRSALNCTEIELTTSVPYSTHLYTNCGKLHLNAYRILFILS